MSGGLPVARILGIEIRISLSWMLLLAVVALIGAEQAAVTAPLLPVAAQWLIGGAVAVGFLLSVIAHELAHALTGRRLGVEVKVVVIGFAGGLAPLSIPASRPRDELAIALAGPLLSLLFALVSLPLALAAGIIGSGFTAVAGGLIVIGGLNLVLGVLSLLPGMPLDGGRVVRALAWARSGDADRASRTAAQVGRLLGWTTFGVGLALAVLDRFTEGILVIGLGWVLTRGAQAQERKLGLAVLLRGVTVGEAIQVDVPQVGPGLTIDTFADRFEGEHGVPALPVVEDGVVLGVIGVRRLQRLGRRKFAATRAADIMTTPPQVPFVGPEDPLWDAVEVMNLQAIEGVAVAVDGRFEGMLTRDSVGALVRRLAAAAQAARG